MVSPHLNLMNNVDVLRNDIAKILRKKYDKEEYKHAIKKCKKAAMKGFAEPQVGESYRPLERAL